MPRSGKLLRLLFLFFSVAVFSSCQIALTSSLYLHSLKELKDCEGGQLSPDHHFLAAARINTSVEFIFLGSNLTPPSFPLPLFFTLLFLSFFVCVLLRSSDTAHKRV
ncbi:unnamed protein product [Mortierella alpina]